MSRFPRPRSRAPLPQQEKGAWTIRFNACVCAALLLAAPATVCGDAAAQAYPARPIRMIVAFPAGGPTDLQARVVAKKLGEALGQQVVVDNRGGAGGMIGADLAAKSAPDGYTLFFGTISMVLAPTFTAKPSYDPVKDFAAITMVSTAPFLVLVHPSIPARSMKEFIALAKARPGQLAFSTSGNGTPPHLAGELLKSIAGIDIIHVPHKGAAPALTDLLAGEVAMSFINPLLAVPQMRAGKVRALATTGIRRSPSLPDVPTMAEAGVPGVEIGAWFALLAPAGTSAETVARLHSETLRLMATPEVHSRLEADGADPVGLGPNELAAYIRSEYVKWSKVVKQAGLRIE